MSTWSIYQKMAGLIQGLFNPKHPEKVIGNVKNMVYRSSYELKYMMMLDNDESVVRYSSEEVVIPYFSPIDNRRHRYFIDFYVERLLPDGTIEKVLIELKPSHQVMPPKQLGNRRKKTFIKEVTTYAVNQAKWDAAIKYAKQNGMTFRVLTEYDIGIKKR